MMPRCVEEERGGNLNESFVSLPDVAVEGRDLASDHECGASDREAGV